MESAPDPRYADAGPASRPERSVTPPLGEPLCRVRRSDTRPLAVLRGGGAWPLAKHRPTPVRYSRPASVVDRPGVCVGGISRLRVDAASTWLVSQPYGAVAVSLPIRYDLLAELLVIRRNGGGPEQQSTAIPCCFGR